MKRTLFALLLLAPVLPPSVSHADGPISIDEFLESGGRTRVIAHRGFSGAAPENTIAAIRAAVDIGADMAEVDVTLSADDRVVVIHDDTLDRTTDGRGAVSGLTLAELQRLDAGSWFAPRFAGERIPTLEAVLAEVKGKILLNVEIKSEAVQRGIVGHVVAAVRDRGMTGQVMVSSFSPAALEQTRLAAPEIRTAVLFDPDVHKGRDPVDIVRGLGASAFNIKQARLTRTMLKRCREAGIPVAVYTVNSVRRLRKVVDRGVHAVFTDHPERMAEVLWAVDSGRRPAVPTPRAAPDAFSGTDTETETGTGSATPVFVMGVP